MMRSGSPGKRAQPGAQGAEEPGKQRAGRGGRAPRPFLPTFRTLPQSAGRFFRATGAGWYSPSKQLCADTVQRGGANRAPLQCGEESEQER